MHWVHTLQQSEQQQSSTQPHAAGILSRLRTAPRTAHTTRQTQSEASVPKNCATPSSVSAWCDGGESGASPSSPASGTVTELRCREGDQVDNGQVLVVVEADDD